MNEDYLLLKWGTLKGWCFENSPESFEALKKFAELGMSMGAMQQENTLQHKELICQIIDHVNGPITNDWTGKEMTKDEAKKYVMDYDL